MASMNAVDTEVIKKLHNVRVPGVRGFGCVNVAEQLHLVHRGLSVMLRGLHDLQRDVRFVGEIPRQPHGGKVSPTELPGE